MSALRWLTLFSMVTLFGCEPNALVVDAADDSLQDEGEHAVVAGRAQTHTRRLLFDGGAGGYHSYRIPSIVTTKSGVLIAFAEGRDTSNEDFGNINLVYKVSKDHGATWSALKEVVGKGPGTWGNPTAVVDRTTGRVWLFMSWNDGDVNQFGTEGKKKISKWGDRKVYVTFSDDDGASFSSPKDMTATLLPKTHVWDAMGPGVGIDFDGKLVIPALQRFIVSEDHGKTWFTTPVPGGTSESTVVGLKDGRLLRNDRATSGLWRQAHRRWVTRGTIEGGFPKFTADDALLDPRAQASMVRYSSDVDRIAFLNPASSERRCKMRVRLSYDGGKTWPISRELYDELSASETCSKGKGGYSSMTKTANATIAALVETNEAVGDDDGHRSIELHVFNLPWMLDGHAEPKK